MKLALTKGHIQSHLKGHRAFTLIELLVVIAIIGILSSVVLASLNTARAKGADAAIKSNLANARAEAELFYDSNGSTYTGVCAASGASNIIGDSGTAAAAANSTSVSFAIGAIGDSTHVACNTNGTAWAMQAPLKTTGFYCVDSTGQAVQGASSVITTTSDTLCS
jgi:prepilin-type N-terminal cleavage/methylation domain-containing protein